MNFVVKVVLLLTYVTMTIQHEAYPPGIPPPNMQAHGHQQQHQQNLQFQQAQHDDEEGSDINKENVLFDEDGQGQQQFHGQGQQQFQGQGQQQFQGHQNTQQFQQQQPPQHQQQQQQFQQQQHHQQQQQQQHGGGHHHPGGHQGFGQNQMVHDADHIKEHLKEVVDKPKEEMSEEELEFHYFKLHDYDSNNRLDGTEIVKAITHFHEEGEQHEASPDAQQQKKVFSDEELVNIVDLVLKEDDLNLDGYIEYAEFVTAQRRARANEQKDGDKK